MFLPIEATVNIQKEIRLDSNWSGSHYSLYDSDKNKSYIEPYIGMSLFPYINLKSEKIFKLFIGYEIKSLNKTLNKNELLQKRYKWKLGWSFNVNKNIKEGCFKIDSDKKNYENINSEIKVLINRKNSINLNNSCLKKGEWNDINISWSPTENGENFLDKTGILRIRFFLPKKIDKNINFTNLKQIRIKNSYFYFIKTKLNKKPIISDIFSEEFVVNSKLKNEYKDAISINKIIDLNYLNLYINGDKFKEFIEYFSFELIWEEIRKFKNNLTFNIKPNIESELINELKKEKLSGKLFKNLDQIKKYVLIYKNQTININFNILKLDFLFNKDYLDDFKIKNLISNFNTSFDFNISLFPMKIVFFQKTTLQNETFNKHLLVKTNFVFDFNKENLKIEIWIPFKFLYELKELSIEDAEKYFLKNKILLKYV